MLSKIFEFKCYLKHLLKTFKKRNKNNRTITMMIICAACGNKKKNLYSVTLLQYRTNVQHMYKSARLVKCVYVNLGT